MSQPARVGRFSFVYLPATLLATRVTRGSVDELKIEFTCVAMLPATTLTLEAIPSAVGNEECRHAFRSVARELRGDALLAVTWIVRIFRANRDGGLLATLWTT